VLGAGLVYALGTWVPLPSHVPVIADPTTRLDAQDASFGTIESRLGHGLFGARLRGARGRLGFACLQIDDRWLHGPRFALSHADDPSTFRS
jgi:hypothetical protein